MKTLGRSIELFFHDGDPDGMTTATIPFQWTGHVLVSNRTQVFDVLREPETAQPGIYLLIGEKNGTETMYVGETDEIRARIKQHISKGKKDWWERAIFVTATGEPLNKAHSRYLESRVYKLANQIGKIAVDNTNEPTESQLNKAATAHMEDFLRNLRLVLPALRFDFLTEQTKPSSDSFPASTSIGVTYFVLSTKEVTARAWKDGGEFIVEAGSRAREDWVGSTTKNSTYGRLYQQLVAQGIITDVKGERVFAENYAFKSVSAAASVVTGRPTAGPRAWHMEDNPKTNFGKYERELAKQQD